MGRVKKKRKRNIKPVADTLKVLKAALTEIEAVSDAIESAKYGLDEAEEAARAARDEIDKAVGEVDGIVEVLRERINKLSTTRPRKKG